MKRFDKIILSILGGLLVLILILVFTGAPGGVEVELLRSGEDQPIGVYGPIQMHFQQKMDQDSVESAFRIIPQVHGTFIWDETSLAFLPKFPLEPETSYIVELLPGARSASGHETRKSASWEITVRPPDIIYLQLRESGGDIWLWDNTNRATLPLTETEGRILDFDISRSGQWIVFSTLNISGGSDLWLMDRNGENQTLLLECSSEQCDQPAFSIDEKWVAYARKIYDAETELYDPSRIWTINTSSAETAQLYQSDDAYGHSPSFSPDGKKLAIYDTTQNAIRILDLHTSQESAIPTVIQESGDWSQDGQQLMYTDLLPSTIEPDGVVYIADLDEQTITQILDEEMFGSTISQPRWTPDGDWLAVAIRPVNRWINKTLWIFKIDGSEAFPVVDDPSAVFSSYEWNPSGEQLVYQRLETGSSMATSIWLWNKKTRLSEQLVENGARPQWLP
jgi:Tol biopolymer transport system component